MRAARRSTTPASQVAEPPAAKGLSLPPAVTGAPKPAWRQPRFTLGIALVAASVALGSWAVSRAGAGVSVLAAVHDLSPGDVVSAADVRTVSLAWDGAPGMYATTPLPEGAVVVSFVGAGELVPTSALGQAEDITGRPIAVPLATGVKVEPGTVVDLWAVPEGNGVGETPQPAMLAESITVLGVEEDDSLLGADQVARVLVPAEVVAQVLAAAANDATLTLVEHPGG